MLNSDKMGVSNEKRCKNFIVLFKIIFIKCKSIQHFVYDKCKNITISVKKEFTSTIIKRYFITTKKTIANSKKYI